MNLNNPIFVLGLQIGVGVAVVGALADYLLARRRNHAQTVRQLPGCLLYTGGGLALAGVLAILASLIFRGTIGPALSLGAGVLGGFYAGFGVLFFAYFLFRRFRPDSGE